MESKKTFGAYICRRRKELGLTQREFADKLFVTESAVSKWERGMSYPDITLIRDICAILQVSEHELLTASEDVEARTAETLAKKYLRLTRRVRMVQLLLYGGTAVLCLACNCLCSQHLQSLHTQSAQYCTDCNCCCTVCSAGTRLAARLWAYALSRNANGCHYSTHHDASLCL